MARRKKKKLPSLNIKSDLTEAQIAQLVSVKRASKGSAGLPIIDINEDLKPEIVAALKHSLLSQALGYHVDNTSVTSYYDHEGRKVTNRMGVFTELTNERKYVPPNLKAALTLLETLEPSFFNGGSSNTPQIIDDWGVSSDDETNED